MLRLIDLSGIALNAKKRCFDEITLVKKNTNIFAYNKSTDAALIDEPNEEFERM